MRALSKTPFPAAIALILLVAGCASGPAVNETPHVANPPPNSSQTVQQLGSPFSDPRSGPATVAFPLLLDRSDVALGTTVQFNRVPNVSELNDLNSISTLHAVIITLSGWPLEYAPLDPLNLMPPEIDLIVILPGYPPTRGAAEAWNMLRVRQRIIVVVNGPPATNTVIGDLNNMRGLERVVCQTDNPDRRGFERLQRPLSFRMLIE